MDQDGEKRLIFCGQCVLWLYYGSTWLNRWHNYQPPVPTGICLHCSFRQLTSNKNAVTTAIIMPMLEWPRPLGLTEFKFEGWIYQCVVHSFTLRLQIPSFSYPIPWETGIFTWMVNVLWFSCRQVSHGSHGWVLNRKTPDFSPGELNPGFKCCTPQLMFLDPNFWWHKSSGRPSDQSRFSISLNNVEDFCCLAHSHDN